MKNSAKLLSRRKRARHCGHMELVRIIESRSPAHSTPFAREKRRKGCRDLSCLFIQISAVPERPRAIFCPARHGPQTDALNYVIVGSAWADLFECTMSIHGSCAPGNAFMGLITFWRSLLCPFYQTQLSLPALCSRT